MAQSVSPRNVPNKFRPNFWGFLQNVLVASINRGVLPIAGVVVVLLIMILKLPNEETMTLFRATYGIFRSWYMLGWGLCGILIIIWYFAHGIMKRNHAKELERMRQELERTRVGNMPVKRKIKP